MDWVYMNRLHVKREMENYNYIPNKFFDIIHNYTAFGELPDAMSEETLKTFKLRPPEIPLMHGCTFMTGDPITVCYSCEFYRDRKNYMVNVKHKERLLILYEYFNNSRKALSILRECDKSLVEEILAYLNTPRDKRMYTDSQIMDTNFEQGGEVVVVLRKLGAIYKNGLQTA